MLSLIWNFVINKTYPKGTFFKLETTLKSNFSTKLKRYLFLMY